jgi:hypothetical protein
VACIVNHLRAERFVASQKIFASPIKHVLVRAHESSQHQLLQGSCDHQTLAVLPSGAQAIGTASSFVGNELIFRNIRHLVIREVSKHSSYLNLLAPTQHVSSLSTNIKSGCGCADSQLCYMTSTAASLALGDLIRFCCQNATLQTRLSVWLAS